jgi:XTP/dITP diphosphohydrolase
MDMVCDARYSLQINQETRKTGKETKIYSRIPGFQISFQLVIELLLATRNTHKTREVQGILGAEFKIADLTGYPELPDIAETGKSFKENAILKAVAVSKRMPGLMIADDSGLEVDALGGAPGIHSARYASAKATDAQKIRKLLAELDRVGATNNTRSARFRCILALAREGNVLHIFEGVVEGKISDRPRGSQGFGYDPVFIPDGLDQTFGELGPAEKNKLSHRARALEQLRSFLTR